MKRTAELVVRHPYVNEVPEELIVGFETFKIDPEWQWVACHNGKVVAQMLATNAHGILMILRLTALPSAPVGWAFEMFRVVFRECNEMGMLGYMTVLEDSSRAELRLMRIIKRANGYLRPMSGVWAAGRFDHGY